MCPRSRINVPEGFTLIEMLVAVTIVSILLLLGVPAIANLVRDSRLLSESYAFRAALNEARSAALSRREFVSFCSSADGVGCGGGWRDGFIAFEDSNGNLSREAVDEALILSRALDVGDDMTIRFDGAMGGVRFDSSGYALSHEGSFVFCDSRGAAHARALTVAGSGMVAAAVDSDGDGVVNLAGGNASCD